MTVTMKKPQVEGTKIEVAEPKLRFKITNTKAAHYPNTLLETDYHKLKTGDVVIIGTNYNVLYEVIEISRQLLPMANYQTWKKRLYNQTTDANGNPILIPRDNKLANLLDEYIEKNHFGICLIRLQTLIGGNNISRRKSVKVMYEPDMVKAINYRYQPTVVSVEDMIKRKQSMQTRAQIAANRAVSKANLLDKSILALTELRDELGKKKPPVVVPAPVPVPDLPAEMPF